MIVLAVAIYRKGEQFAAPAVPSDWKRFETHNYSVGILSAPPYGFFSETSGRVVTGEAVGPLSESDIRQLSDRAAKQTSSAGLEYGIYLAALIDKNSGQFLIANSISASRPYYLFQDEQRIILSSSFRGMRQAGLHLEINENAYPELMVYRFVSPPSSLIKSVRLIPGGERLEFDLATFKLLTHRSFPFPDYFDANVNVTSVTEKTEDILSGNIVHSLRASKRPGMLLSGGLDSSLIALLAVKKNQRPDSVSSGFSFANVDDLESEYATTVADHLGIHHRIFEGTEEIYLRGLIEAIYHAEMPLHHLQSVMLYLLFCDAKERGNDLFLCGEAADGLFGNDAHQRCHKFRSINSLLNIPPLRAMIRAASSMRPDDYRLSFFAHEFGSRIDSDRHFLYNLGQCTQMALVKSLFGYDLSQVVSSHRQLMQPFAEQPLLNQISIISLLCEGAITMSVWSKLAEGASLRIVYPFAADNMIDHVYSLPWETKLIEPKYIIREILRTNMFNEEFITRPKRSFGFPSEFWALPGTLFQPLVDLAATKFGAALFKQLQRTEMSPAILQWNLINIYLFEELIVRGVEPKELADDVIARHRSLKRSGA